MGDIEMKRLLAGVSMIILIGGCVTSEPTRLDAQFGNSVASMIEGQTYNPVAASDPESRPVMTMDGVKAQGNLEAYRRDVPNRPEVHDIRDFGID
jgi:hypothetical protein